jgi:hypothetical protein
MLAAAFTQQGGGAVGMNIAAGLGGQVFVPHVTTALPALPAAPVAVPTLGAPAPAWMTGVISIWLLPSPALLLPQPRAAQMPTSELVQHAAFVLFVIPPVLC